MAEINPMVPVSALRAIAVEAIRSVTGCPDVSGNGKHLTDEIEAVARAAAESLRTTSQPVGVPEGWLYDWTHSSALGKPDEEFTTFTKDRSHAFNTSRGNRNPRPVYLTASPTPPAAQADAAKLNAEGESYQRMFLAACEALGAISEALDLDPDDGGAEPILDAIEELRERLPEGWRLVEKKTHYQLNNGSAVVANLAGPDAAENAATLARLLSAAPTAAGDEARPMTDEQILHIVDTYVGPISQAHPLDNSDWIAFARAIEVRHGIVASAEAGKVGG